MAKDKTGVVKEPSWSVDFLTLTFPLPEGIPADVLKSASIVVKAKPAQGRRRAGYGFSREETVIPLSDLDQKQIEAITGDDELVVSLRVPKPESSTG